MRDISTLMLVALFALAFPLLSKTLSEPPESPSTRAYREDYKAFSDKGQLSPDEFRQLKEREAEYVADLLGKESVEEQVEHIMSRKLAIVPVGLSLCFLFGYLFGFSRIHYLIAGTAMLGILPLAFVNFLEALSYASLFLIGNLLFLRRIRSTD